MKRLVSLLVAAAMLLVAFSAVAEEISGPLVLYSSMTDNDIDNLIEAFNEVYPNVEVEVVNGSAGELAARIRAEKDNPINRALIALYRPVLDAVLRFPKLTLASAGVVLLLSLIPLLRLGSEFMPPLEEGTLLYMPTALPGLSAGKASQQLQLTDRMLKMFRRKGS